MKGAAVVNIDENVMVCVTQQRTCERLIKRGAALSEKLKGELYVIHVAKEGVNFLGNKREGDALEYLFNISKGVGANLTVIRSNDVVKAIIDYAENNNIKHIVLGQSPEDNREDGIIAHLQDSLENCETLIIPENELE